MKKYFVLIPILPLFVLLAACNGFFDKDNTPAPAVLTQYNPEIQPHMLWSTKTNVASQDSSMRLAPVLQGETIYAVSSKGTVSAFNRLNGALRWQVNTNSSLSTGPGVGNGVVMVGGQKGSVLALNQDTGKVMWKIKVPGELLANPAVAHNVGVVKTLDGTVSGLSLKDGKVLWSYQTIEPSLILRGASAPLIAGRSAIVGFANGTLAKLDLANGKPEWLQTIATSTGAFSIQRMIDIVANPILFNQSIYTATYQGQIAVLDVVTGKKRWSHDISSYAGMAVDDHSIYVSDASSHIWSFGTRSGKVNWKQDQLNARNITAPAIIGDYIVVGDAEGYLHWINAQTGRLAARDRIGTTISTPPLVKNGVLYAFANNGNLVAYRLDHLNHLDHLDHSQTTG